jgi:hypothetical protein
VVSALSRACLLASTLRLTVGAVLTFVSCFWRSNLTASQVAVPCLRSLSANFTDLRTLTVSPITHFALVILQVPCTVLKVNVASAVFALVALRLFALLSLLH